MVTIDGRVAFWFIIENKTSPLATDNQKCQQVSSRGGGPEKATSLRSFNQMHMYALETRDIIMKEKFSSYSDLS